MTTLWASEERYYPLHVAAYTPEKRLAGGKQDPAFCTKPQIALSLIEQALGAGILFCAIVADYFFTATIGPWKKRCLSAAYRMCWTLVCCAFAFCWWADAVQARASEPASAPPEAGKNQPHQGAATLADPAARGARLVDPGALACALLGRLGQRAPAGRARRVA